ncbi:ABC-type dipeptide/oligopeptide/nickel transport system ATPase component [Bradyrhizobium japonicum]
MSASPLIEIKDLRIRFHGDDGRVTHAVDSVDLSVANGATLGLVGESGCGKSVTSLAIMGLLPKQSAEISDAIRFDGFDLLKTPDQTLRDLRGNRLAMIFQEPMTSLNPSFTIGDQITETILRHRGGSRKSARERAVELLRRVHIPSPERRIDEYPHKLSGGMRQRVMIAMALACDPRLLIADEPTTALDVTLQAQILELMRELKAASGAAIILITHDLDLVAEVCDEVAVMYAGEIVERAPVDELFAMPQHPYTVGLLGSIPRLDHPRRAACHDRGHGAEHGAATRRLPLRRALPLRAGRLHRGAAAAGRGQPRPPLALHPRTARTSGVVMASFSPLVPRAQRSTSEAQRCAAEPGPMRRQTGSRFSVATLRAAPRPGHETEFCGEHER